MGRPLNGLHADKRYYACTRSILNGFSQTKVIVSMAQNTDPSRD